MLAWWVGTGRGIVKNCGSVFNTPISIMFNFRIATSGRTAVVGVCIGLVTVFVASGCGPGMPSAPPTTTTSGMRGTPSAAPPPTTTGMQGTAAASPTATSGVYGNPTSAAVYWQQQSIEDNCGLLSVADVVGEITGDEPTESEIIALADKTPSQINPGPIYVSPSQSRGGGGIAMADEVVLLEHYGIKSVMTDSTHPDQTGLSALEHYLADGRKVIAWVNSATIWNTSDQRTKADHFLVVTGIDTNQQITHLNDPGADHPDEQVSISTFMTAWQTGGDSLVVTGAAS